MSRLFGWWDRLTMPSYGSELTVSQRERLRYAQLISRFSLLMLILTLSMTPDVVLFQSQPIALGVLAANVLLILALIFNRCGFTLLAGSCGVLYGFVAITPAIFFRTMDAPHMALFDYLLIIVVVAGALLPPVSALIVGLIDCAIIWVSLTMMPRSLDLDSLLQHDAYSIIVPPMILQIIVAIICYVIIKNMLAAIRRANRAEEIVALQKEIAAHEQARISENRQMEEGLANVAQVLSRAAHGKLDARANVMQGSVIWAIAGPLNILLNRAQSWKEDSNTFAYTRQVAEEVTKRLQDAHIKRQPVLFVRTGTVLDPILREINRSSEPDTSQMRHPSSWLSKDTL